MVKQSRCKNREAKGKWNFGLLYDGAGGCRQLKLLKSSNFQLVNKDTCRNSAVSRQTTQKSGLNTYAEFLLIIYSSDKLKEMRHGAFKIILLTAFSVAKTQRGRL